MKNHLYQAGMHYEALMRRALNCNERSIRKGTCGSIYETLFRIENGTALVRISYEKQLATVKSHLHKGIDAFLKRNFSPDKKVLLMGLKTRLNDAYYLMEIDNIINQTLDIVIV